MDWASPATLEKGLLSFFWENTVLINTSKGAKHVPNPFCSYILSQDLGTLKLAGNSANLTKRPYTPDNGVHFTPKEYATIRYPDPNYVPK
ncbi:Di-copper centre-containing protein [Gigaspora margarita]|uniref:Di-copper centre-containing protein n=1 Tax=Gigaspora margarita TaxID=4874 RepID=A0A8H3X6A1_GIGMA|nr:Di-copper centre-containing protein [Gigaspora margarita]